MDPNIITYLVQQGGGYALAALLFFFYRKDLLKKVEEEKADKEILIDLISGTKSAIQELTYYIKKDIE